MCLLTDVVDGDSDVLFLLGVTHTAMPYRIFLSILFLPPVPMKQLLFQGMVSQVDGPKSFTFLTNLIDSFHIKTSRALSSVFTVKAVNLDQ